MDEQPQGITDQPVSDDEMAAVDQAATQFGAVVQPTNSGTTADTDANDTTIQPDNSPSAVIEPSAPAETAAEVPVVDPAPTDTPIADALNADAPPDTASTSGDVPEPAAPGVAADDTTSPSTQVSDVDDDDIPEPVKDGGEDASPAIVGTGPVISPVGHPPLPGSSPGTGDDDELLDVKQEALQELTPLVETLDLPPEERFDTLMMIIRASDDKNLVKPAKEAASQITDQDKKARALLDVVNEVNFLTQNGPESQQSIVPEADKA